MNESTLKSLPNLVIAGIRKGGTTSLAQYLAQHPEICSSELKKVGYFLPLKYGDPVPPLATYAAHFQHCTGRYRMEATTGYFLGGETIARALTDALPDARVLISLREPVDAMWSYYRFVRSHARIDPAMSFEQYLDRCRAMTASGEDLLRDNNAFLAYRGGFYDEPLTAWADALGDSLRVVFFDDMRDDARGMLRALCGWLGIDPAPVDAFDLDVHNKSVQVKNHQAQKVALRVNERAKRFLRRHHGVKRRVRSLYYAVNQDRSPQPKLDPQLRRTLEAEYAESTAAVAELLTSRELSDELPPWLRPDR